MVISARLSNQSIFHFVLESSPLLKNLYKMLSKHLISIQIFASVIVTYSTICLEAILFELQLNASIFGGNNTYCWYFDNSMIPSFLVDHYQDRITYHHLLVSLNDRLTSLYAMPCCDKSSTRQLCWMLFDGLARKPLFSK